MTLAKRHLCRLVDILFFDRTYDVRSDYYHVMIEDVMTTDTHWCVRRTARDIMIGWSFHIIPLVLATYTGQ